jgi:hypothetical protein
MIFQQCDFDSGRDKNLIQLCGQWHHSSRCVFLSNPIKLALKSDLTPRFVDEIYDLPFPASGVLVTLLTIFQQDSFGTFPKDHVVTLGWDKKAPQTIQIPPRPLNHFLFIEPVAAQWEQGMLIVPYGQCIYLYGMVGILLGY